MYLSSALQTEFRLTTEQKKALAKLGVVTVEDLLRHFPLRYGNTSEMKNIEALVSGENATIFGKISGLKTSKAFIKKIPMSEGVVTDETGSIQLVWFNQPYIAKMIPEGSLVRVEGKVATRKQDLYISNPKIERVTKIPDIVGHSLFGDAHDEHSLYPVYAESRGVTSLWMYHTVQKILGSGILDTLTDPVPVEILKKYNLPSLSTAFVWIHAPKNENDALAARKRFAFEEIFFIQLEKQKEKKLWSTEKSFTIETPKKALDAFIETFPFTPTDSQREAIDSIISDFHRGFPMSRLLEGDVGSGKTAVAAATVFAVTRAEPRDEAGKPITGNLQAAYMVPTEILAKQHFENFISYFRGSGLSIGLITGSGCKKFPSKTDPSGSTTISRAQLLKWVANGEIPILIGTHALIQKSVVWKHLALAIIDEQHRFGTLQRQKLTTKSRITPHLLSMTATPIPRTLALTIYGDLDLTVLSGMPHGRKPVETKVILPSERDATYEDVRRELRAGRQLYVICPRIAEADPTKENALNAKSVVEEAARLKKEVFPEYTIDILHSKMTPAEKETVMGKFERHETDILVATSVVEVGVNVPNATVIIIEGAERFGLSQLHQLRGRVIRSNHQAYCYIFTETNSQKSRDRLKALTSAKNGFELAEFDLKSRGVGELYGRKQWGISDLAMDAIKNIKLVEASRLEATRLIDEDSELKKHPATAECLVQRSRKIHFE